jgi:hypothetical protein
VLLEVIHSALPQPMRFVVDTVTITSNGHDHMPIAASLSFPDDYEGRAPSARLTLDNVGRPLSRVLEDTYGLRGAKLRMQQVYRGRPDVVEHELLLDMKEIACTPKAFTCTLSYDNILDLVGTPMSYRPSTKPGLF